MLLSPLSRLTKVSCWKPLNKNTLKLNINGVIFTNLQDAGIVVLLRYSKGDVLMAAKMKERHIQSPKSMKALAIFRIIQPCLHRGISHQVVESDCQSVILMLQDAAKSDSPIGNIIHEIKALRVYFQSCTFQFCYHPSNFAGHSLA